MSVSIWCARRRTDRQVQVVDRREALAAKMEPMVQIGFVVGGLAVLALTWWSRAGRTHRARWWANRGDGGTLDERMVLFFLPSIGLFGIAVGPLMSFEPNNPAHTWMLVFAPLLLVAFVLLVWGGLILPVPRWYLPAWLRARRPPRRRRGR